MRSQDRVLQKLKKRSTIEKLNLYKNLEIVYPMKSKNVKLGFFITMFLSTVKI